MAKRVKSLPILLAGMLLAAPAAADGFQDRAISLVNGIFKAADAAATNKSKTAPGDPDNPLRKFIASRIATEALARFAVGHYWRRSSEEQRTQFHTLFRGYMTLMLGRHVHNLARRKLTVQSVMPAPDAKSDVIVMSRIGEGRRKLLFDWRIRKTKAGPKIVDVMVEGISMAVAQRQEFMSYIKSQQGDLGVLIARLEKQVPHSKPAKGNDAAQIASPATRVANAQR